MPDPSVADAANSLYWESDASVADVAAQFDLSRRALYEAIRPYPAGLDCDECGAELEYTNRLARQRETASCPVCGRVQVGPDDQGEDGPTADRAARAAAGVAYDSRDDGRTTDLRQRAVFLSGAAIAGIAIGTVATWLARRRD